MTTIECSFMGNAAQTDEGIKNGASRRFRSPWQRLLCLEGDWSCCRQLRTGY